MLNIPEAVKALYLNDTTLHSTKNFRVLFPDGELSEEFPNGITCENIVEESVDFTESICSAMNFRFGLAEAPNISFETVGVPNILGVRIACYSEIDVSGVADDLTGDYDGEYVSLEDSDLGFPFYRIPLGVFTVDSCTRNHGNMTHRRITAFGAGAFNGELGGLSDFEKAKLKAYWAEDTYILTPNFWYSQLYASYPFTRNFTAEEDAAVTYRNGLGARNILLERVKLTEPTMGTVLHGFQLDLNVPIDFDEEGGFTLTTNEEALYGFYATNYDATRQAVHDSVQAFVDQLVEDYDADFTGASINRPSVVFESNEHAVEALTDSIMGLTMGQVGPFYISETTLSANTGFHLLLNRPNGTYLFSTKGPGNAQKTTMINCGAKFYGYSVSITYPTTSVVTPPNIAAADERIIYDFKKLTPLNDVVLSIPNYVLESTLETEINNRKRYSFSNSFSFKKLLDGLLETLGRFFRANRDGTYKVFALDDTINENVPTNIIRSLWWDEADIEEIGSVDFQFKDAENKTQDGSLSIGDGESTYVMRQNYFLQNMDDATVESISELLSGEFAAHCQDLTWTPTEAETRGLPYVEAGDYITCATQAQDVTEVKFPMLRRTLSGIQSLREDISSVAGEVVDSAGGGLSV